MRPAGRRLPTPDLDHWWTTFLPLRAKKELWFLVQDTPSTLVKIHIIHQYYFFSSEGPGGHTRIAHGSNEALPRSRCTLTRATVSTTMSAPSALICIYAAHLGLMAKSLKGLELPCLPICRISDNIWIYSPQQRVQTNPRNAYGLLRWHTYTRQSLNKKKDKHSFTDNNFLSVKPCHICCFHSNFAVYCVQV